MNIIIGKLCRHTRRSTFKLALVVGGSLNNSGRIRVRIWRAVSGRWTMPQLVDADSLVELTEGDWATRKHGKTINAARNAALRQKLVGSVIA